jgi:maleate cis-trans isomerase
MHTDKEPLDVGLMVPINNTTMEPELLAWLPEGSSCRTLRIPRGKSMLTPDTLPEYLAQAAKLAQELKHEHIDLVVYGCTAAGFMAGPARDAQVAAELAAITGKRVVTTAGSMSAVLESLGARTIALITPYLDHVNETLKTFLAPSGIRIEVLSSFRAQTVDELAAITSTQIAERARAAMRPGIDAMFIACSQLPTLAIIPELERELGIPVWSSIKATAWQALRAAEKASL